MIDEAGVDSIAFVTFTLGERGADGKWLKVWCQKEASRRLNNLARHVLRGVFEKFVLVTERDKEGGVHFHALAVVAGRPDVRTGVDHAAIARGDYRTGTPALRGLWAVLRSKAVTDLGFGRAEALPVRSCGEAVADYVAKYIEKNLAARPVEDRGSRLVRYHGFKGRHLTPNGFCWATPKACEWRRKAMFIASTARLWTPAQMARNLGPRWAYRVHGAMFDLRLESWREGRERPWTEDEATRDQIELAKEFVERDARSFAEHCDKSASASEQWEMLRSASSWHEVERAFPSSAEGRAKRAREQPEEAAQMEVVEAWREWDNRPRT